MTTLACPLFSSRDAALYGTGGCITIVSTLPSERGEKCKVAGSGGDLTLDPLATAASRVEMRLLSETRSVLEYLPKLSVYIQRRSVGGR
jgi:hypothetical protein